MAEGGWIAAYGAFGEFHLRGFESLGKAGVEFVVVLEMGWGFHGFSEMDEGFGESFGPVDVFHGHRNESCGAMGLPESGEAHFEGGGSVADIGEFSLWGHPDNGIGLGEYGL